MKKFGLFGLVAVFLGVMIFPILTFAQQYYSYPVQPVYPTFTQPITLTATFVPHSLPNTGFPPLSSAAFAFAAVLFLAAGLVLTPYAKKFVTAIR